MFLIFRGIVKLTCDSPSGETALFALRYPGQLVEECTYGFDLPYPASGTTLLPCEIHQFDVERMIEAERNNLEVSVFSANIAKRDLYNSCAVQIEMKTVPPVERLARLLGEIAAVQDARPVGGFVEFVLPLNNTEMAQWLGLSGTQYKRIRNKLEACDRVRLGPGMKVALRQPNR